MQVPVTLKSILLSLLMIGPSLTPDSQADDRRQARSTVYSYKGIVASEHPLASQAGIAMLDQGGSAVDAAIAANAVMGVVSPMMCGIGGDLFSIVYEAKDGAIQGLNASGWSARASSIDKLKTKGFDEMPIQDVHSITVPGAVDGWHQLWKKHGRLPWKNLFQPAINHAREGFAVSQWVAEYWADSKSTLQKQGEAERVFMPKGDIPKAGDLFKNPDLARAYTLIAEHGRDSFYDGPITDAILECSQTLEGWLERRDFTEFSSEWVTPISTDYRGWKVYEIPPNGQGIAALSMLNIMEQFPLGDYQHNSAPALHIMIEAKKLAYADMIHYVADPHFAKIPVKEILSKGYARERVKWMDPVKAQEAPNPGDFPRHGSDTTYLCVVDEEGNMISLIQSIYYGFGSGYTVPGMGFMLQNRGGLFTLDPQHPNALAPRKRPLHTIIPGFMEKGDQRIAFGIMGGWNQSQAHAQFVSNLVDYDMNIQQAMEAPRFSKKNFEGLDVNMENRISESSRNRLSEMGHEIDLDPDYSSVMGGGQAVLRDFSKDLNAGASDPRKDGVALSQP